MTARPIPQSPLGPLSREDLRDAPPPALREELRLELRLKVFEIMLRNGYSLNNPEPFKDALDKIEAMVLGSTETTADGDATTNEAKVSPGNPDGTIGPAKTGKGKT
jgi:hypothetical protein